MESNFSVVSLFEYRNWNNLENENEGTICVVKVQLNQY